MYYPVDTPKNEDKPREEVKMKIFLRLQSTKNLSSSAKCEISSFTKMNTWLTSPTSPIKMKPLFMINHQHTVIMFIFLLVTSHTSVTAFEFLDEHEREQIKYVHSLDGFSNLQPIDSDSGYSETASKGKTRSPGAR